MNGVKQSMIDRAHRIRRAVCTLRGITVNEMLLRDRNSPLGSRDSRIVEARKLLALACREIGCSLPMAAMVAGYRSHRSVVTAINGATDEQREQAAQIVKATP